MFLCLKIQQFNEEQAQTQSPIQNQHTTADNTEELNNLKKEIEELNNVVSSLTTDKLVLSKQLEETKVLQILESVHFLICQAIISRATNSICKS